MISTFDSLVVIGGQRGKCQPEYNPDLSVYI